MLSTSPPPPSSSPAAAGSPFRSLHRSAFLKSLLLQAQHRKSIDQPPPAAEETGPTASPWLGLTSSSTAVPHPQTPSLLSLASLLLCHREDPLLAPHVAEWLAAGRSATTRRAAGAPLASQDDDRSRLVSPPPLTTRSARSLKKRPPPPTTPPPPGAATAYEVGTPQDFIEEYRRHHHHREDDEPSSSVVPTYGAQAPGQTSSARLSILWTPPKRRLPDDALPALLGKERAVGSILKTPPIPVPVAEEDGWFLWTVKRPAGELDGNGDGERGDAEGEEEEERLVKVALIRRRVTEGPDGTEAEGERRRQEQLLMEAKLLLLPPTDGTRPIFSLVVWVLEGGGMRGKELSSSSQTACLQSLSVNDNDNRSPAAASYLSASSSGCPSLVESSSLLYSPVPPAAGVAAPRSATTAASALWTELSLPSHSTVIRTRNAIETVRVIAAFTERLQKELSSTLQRQPGYPSLNSWLVAGGAGGSSVVSCLTRLRGEWQHRILNPSALCRALQVMPGVTGRTAERIAAHHRGSFVQWWVSEVTADEHARAGAGGEEEDRKRTWEWHDAFTPAQRRLYQMWVAFLKAKCYS